MDSIPRRSRVSQAIGRQFLHRMGWTLIGEFPSVPKAVFIASPHTSNKDGIIMPVSYTHLTLPTICFKG